MTERRAPRSHSPWAGMLRGTLVASAAGVVLSAGLLTALRGTDATSGALLGSALAAVVLLVGLVGIRAVVSAHASLAMAGALVVYLGQLILLAAAAVLLGGAHWLDGTALAIAAALTTVLVQVGLVRGYARSRHVLFPGVLGGAA